MSTHVSIVIDKRQSMKYSTLKAISKDLRTISTELKISQADKITRYWARHTFATTLKRSGISTAVISEALGRSREATTKDYLNKLSKLKLIILLSI